MTVRVLLFCRMHHEKKHNATTLSRFYIFVLFFVSCLCVWMFYLQSNGNYTEITTLTKIDFQDTFDLAPLSTQNLSITEHLVFSKKCKIPNLNPWNSDVEGLYHPKEYLSCSSKPLLTSISVKENRAVLQIHKDRVSLYSKVGVSCCFSTISRGSNSSDPDNAINTSTCKSFADRVEISGEAVLVKCKRKNRKAKEVYKNVHAILTVREDLGGKLRKDETKLSVLFIGIDSISRLHLLRAMPFTYNFFEEEQWLPLKGYNKVGDNTFPNLMAILTGMNESVAYKKCNPKEVGELDKCHILWYDFRENGYVTGYAEDEASISTFNYFKKGFTLPPTDYYFRPYMLAAENYLPITVVDDMSYCTGAESSGERILNLVEDFVTTFQNYPYFGFFWMNSFSHNKLESVSRMDRKVVEFLRRISSNDILNHTVTIFLSDHGIRFGNIRYTRTGWLEERLPFIYVKFPDWFPVSFPRHYRNFVSNQHKLTNPYDLYMTLQDLLLATDSDYPVKNSDACPKCKSLFVEADTQRSCEDAAIPQHWCTCRGYQKISPKTLTVHNASTVIIDNINEIASSFGSEAQYCAKLKFGKVISSSISENATESDTYLLIILETKPKAVFEGTVSVNVSGNEPTYVLQGDISRIDYYKDHSHCVKDSNLKKYCYCH